MGRLRWLIVPVAVVPIAWLLVQGIGRDPRDIPTALAGEPMPTFSLTNLDGRRVEADALRGRPIVLNFWASWCAPCVEEHAVLADAARRYGDEVAIVGVLYQDEPSAALDFLARYGDYGWPTVIDDGGRLAIEFGVTGPPETFFIDSDGIVRAREAGPVTREVLDAELDPLVAAAEAAR
jgi:cytochrome c biogenesis protein CcmG, thiol:disulfide interchange protein DsbE